MAKEMPKNEKGKSLMRIKPTRRYKKSRRKLSNELQNKVDNAITKLLADWRHPSLRTHKIKAHMIFGKCWSAWVTINVRLLFKVEDGILILEDVGQHDICK